MGKPYKGHIILSCKGKAMPKKEIQYWGIKRLFIWKLRTSSQFSIEERVVMASGTSFEKAFAKVKAEEKLYFRNDPEANFTIKLLTKKAIGFWIIELEDTKVGDKVVEIYSCLHDEIKSKKCFMKMHLPKVTRRPKKLMR